MSGGNDDRDIDPERTTSSGDWWQGPIHGPRAQGPGPQPPPHPHPNTPAPGPNPYRTGPSRYQSAPNPVPPVWNPYATGPNAFQPQPSGSRNRLWLLVAVGALVVAIVAVVAIIFVNHDPGRSASPATTSVTTTTARFTTTTAVHTNTTAPATTLTPTISGYQVVVPTGYKVAWDVPSDWIDDPTATSYGTDADNLPIAGMADEGENYCPDNVRTQMFLTASQISDAAAAAADIGTHVARIGWSTGSAITPGTGQDFKTSDGGMHGTFLETKGTFTAPAGCATTFSVYTFAVSAGDKGSLVLVIGADTGMERSMTPGFARRIFGTLRTI
ncbi:hypothetical protein NS506_00406 [Nocardia seriolae]|uniref:DUF8017 domain-containing protein n=1 Tax=Nocardia seriolae TaxID=37332 RepID=A0ABC8AK81_9NOCA|nr:hypothetical protein NS506_00406 [Nocardia seriolae]BEK84515.1 hypothetical protein NSERKGN1266_04660 [Nocardia seriolae]GEM26883.1 hypothetical protein NS2_51220 [Nocardia seriolae NBRC 15557]